MIGNGRPTANIQVGLCPNVLRFLIHLRIQEERLATAAFFLQSCVAQAVTRGDGPRHSLHASVYYHEYNEGLIFENCQSQ